MMNTLTPVLWMNESCATAVRLEMSVKATDPSAVCSSNVHSATRPRQEDCHSPPSCVSVVSAEPFARKTQRSMIGDEPIMLAPKAWLFWKTQSVMLALLELSAYSP